MTDDEALAHLQSRGIPDATIALLKSLLPPVVATTRTAKYPGLKAIVDEHPTRRPQHDRCLEFFYERFGGIPTTLEARSTELVQQVGKWFQAKGFPAPNRNTVLYAAGRRNRP